MTLRYVTGDTVTLGNTFAVDGVATDPTTVALAVTDPTGTTTTYTYPATLTQVSTGVYSKDITADAVGIWRFVWTGTGTAADVQDSSFTVVTPADLKAYCTIEELGGELGMRATDTTDALKLATSVNAASRQIDRACGQRFWQDTSVVARTFMPDNYSTLCLPTDGISTTTGLVIALDQDDTGTFETALTISTDYVLLPYEAPQMYPVEPYTEVHLTCATYSFTRSLYHRPTVQITARWGWPAVPDDIHKACIIQAAYLFKQKDAALGVVALGLEGAAIRASSSGWQQTARGLIAPYMKPAVG